jgi:hypothetical protein
MRGGKQPGMQAATFVELTSAHGFAFFNQSRSWLSRSAWCLLTFTGAILSAFFTEKIYASYSQPPFYATDISIETTDRLPVMLPDLVICDPSPWDLVKAQELNISREQLSYISYFLHTQRGGPVKMNSALFKELVGSYPTLLQRFDNNPVYLLNNVTKNCTQLMFTCQLGTQARLNESECCSRLFSSVEYVPQFKCFSAGGKLDVPVWEALQVFGILITLKLDNVRSALNTTVATTSAVAFTGVAATVTDKRSSLYHVSQTNIKLLAPNSGNLLSLERKMTDNSEKNSYFQPFQAGGQNEAKLNRWVFKKT